MMKQEKILININYIDELEKYREIGITNFLFAVHEFSIGYNSFDLKDIPDNTYILINRVLDTKDINKLNGKKNQFLRFKGLIFEDTSIIEIFGDTSLELIWYQNHFATNHKSINFFLNNSCTSAVISNEITKEEINSIFENAIKPLVLTVFAKNQIMYSRRKLLTNFNDKYNLPSCDMAILREKISNSKFLAKETDYGTVLFNNDYFNYCDFATTIEDEKIKFYLIINLDLNVEEIINVIKGKNIGNDGFLNKKTVVNKKDYI